MLILLFWRWFIFSRFRISAFVLSIFLVVLLTSAIIVNVNHTEVEKTMAVCTLDGETRELTLRLYWHNHLLIPNELKGYIILDEEKYFSPYGYKYEGRTQRKVLTKYSFFEGVAEKFFKEKKLYSISMSYSERGDKWPHQATGHCNISPFDKLFSYIEVGRHRFSEDSKIFYGPAKTAEEAHEIYNNYLN